MKYVPPWGVSDPDAPYVNGDPTIGRQGSIPPAAQMEHPQREIVAVIAKSGFIPSETDLEQLARGVRSQRLNYAEDTGTANNLVVAYDPPLTPTPAAWFCGSGSATPTTGPPASTPGPARFPFAR